MLNIALKTLQINFYLKIKDLHEKHGSILTKIHYHDKCAILFNGLILFNGVPEGVAVWGEKCKVLAINKKYGGNGNTCFIDITIPVNAQMCTTNIETYLADSSK